MDMIVPNDLAVLEYIENPAAEQKDFPTKVEYLLEKYGTLENAFYAWRIELEDTVAENPPFELFVLLLESHDSTKH